MLFQDARDQQILFLCAFLFLGISTRDWTLRVDLILVAILSCLFTQVLLSLLVNYLKSQQLPSLPAKHSDNQFDVLLNWEVISSWRSAMITGLGLCLLLRGNHYTTMAIAGCLAIASKFLFRFRGKHFFNPANFGMIATLIISNDAWVSPGQWGTDWWYLLLFAGTGGMIVNRVGRWDTSAAFLLAYTGLEALRHLWLGWSWDVLQHQLMSGSLLLFAFFMLSDPRSIPNACLSRIIWAFSIALLTLILRDYFGISTALFWALFALAPGTIFLDAIWSAPRFLWRDSFLKCTND